jgi:hypothetical protein
MSSAALEDKEAFEMGSSDAVSPVDADSAATWADLHEREVTQTATLVAILKQASPGEYRHWGINE